MRFHLLCCLSFSCSSVLCRCLSLFSRYERGVGIVEGGEEDKMMAHKS